jgi:DNA-binding transcriptional MerR regulator
VDKSPDAYRTISEVADDLGLPQHVLRFWETRFTQIKPLKRGGGRRYYRPDDIDLVKGIKHLLYGTGYTIKGVQRILKDQGVKHVQSIGRTGQIEPVAPAAAPPMRPASAEEEVVFASPLKPRTEAEPVKARTPLPGSAEDLAALIAPGLRAPKRVKRKTSQLGLFGEEESEQGALSPQAMARMLPSAWQGQSVSGQVTQKLELALLELEECSRLLATARMVSHGDEI